ncbi:hypothetical protein MARBORIA2_10920 [Methanobrevibacter arboriphilus]|jgi:regulator of RNase E activity RraA|uniref:Uncharacterized protein n=1 Tax=Methanobrevibacter arboriphilus TaxID=39441 RepID=A0ACA8R5V7_METAZ|nr:RraA family protein [Methanobrevibacter arboriphilus]MCC7562618.1 RraA family protein [Methanobrevibacter arboriphilus]BBL62762.1 hypothetical protein MarbSA_18020 [Methanobrevibacter arboriphilus]GLI12002.1 hypothetical protein MARBORIA2_10920 [Methanobrevibacter arboriphilus]
MGKSKLSAKSLLNEISYKKHLKNKKTILVNDLRVCKEDFEIKNLDILESENSQKTEKIKGKKQIKEEIGFENLKNLLDNTSSCQISDALNKLTRRDGVLKGLKSVNNKTAYGRVVTVESSSDDWGTSLLGIDACKKGNILFIKTSGPSSAVWGELTSTCSGEKGIAGTVIWGATRDINFVSENNYPVFAKETIPNAGNALGLGKVNIPIKISESPDIIIKNGDFIFGDKSGVVHVPQELFCDVMIKALEIKANETNIISEIKKGKPLSQIVGLKDKIE